MEVSNQDQSKEIIVTACSKVLITGAYLVLDPKYQGAVLATDALFTCKIKSESSNNEKRIIKVVSSQFSKTKEYIIDFDQITQEIKIKKEEEDPFLDKSLTNPQMLTTINQDVIELIGDNQFYSWRDYLGNDFNLKAIEQIPSHSNPLDPNKKTGLGSSAALISSFLASTFTYYGLLDSYKVKDKDQDELRKLHIQAQILNAFVQEKVGSGFDIACSIYGSQLYSRFTNVGQLSNIIHILQKYYTSIISADAINEIRESIQEFKNGFDYEFNKFNLNTTLDLCLIDVNTGSDTKIMVKQVLDWAKKNQLQENDLFSNPLFKNLDLNFHNLLKLLQEQTIQDKEIKQCCFKIRELLQIISKETKVDIEPESSKQYLDKILQQLDYAYYAAVPGGNHIYINSFYSWWK